MAGCEVVLFLSNPLKTNAERPSPTNIPVSKRKKAIMFIAAYNRLVQMLESTSFNHLTHLINIELGRTCKRMEAKTFPKYRDPPEYVLCPSLLGLCNNIIR